MAAVQDSWVTRRRGAAAFGDWAACDMSWSWSNRQPQFNRCGCVYALPMDGTYNAYYMEELVCGT